MVSANKALRFRIHMSQRSAIPQYMRQLISMAQSQSLLHTANTTYLNAPAKVEVEMMINCESREQEKKYRTLFFSGDYSEIYLKLSVINEK